MISCLVIRGVNDSLLDLENGVGFQHDILQRTRMSEGDALVRRKTIINLSYIIKDVYAYIMQHMRSAKDQLLKARLRCLDIRSTLHAGPTAKV